MCSKTILKRKEVRKITNIKIKTVLPLGEMENCSHSLQELDNVLFVGMGGIHRCLFYSYFIIYVFVGH